MMIQEEASLQTISKEEILKDYRIACESRFASLLGRKEVFMGKAKFGIFGDGKEIAQLAMAREFKKGDIRSGYYRDQTFMFAIGELTLEQYFAQLYAHTDVEADPATAGRMMNGHFATRMLDAKGNWKDLLSIKNSSADVSPTAAQMPRLIGLAYASKLYRENKELAYLNTFSNNGNEVAWGTIGNASTSEGMFFEAFNAAGVLQIPVIISVWDDDYGISVPSEYQTTKSDISKILSGFQRNENEKGFEIFRVKGWNYIDLCNTYAKASIIAREEHVPVLVHVLEMTQPQGHSTSGSHERYKSKDRLTWEEEFDCIPQMRKWMIENDLATEEELNIIEVQSKDRARDARNKAWEDFNLAIKPDFLTALSLLDEVIKQSYTNEKIVNLKNDFSKIIHPLRQDIVRTIKRTMRYIRNENLPVKKDIKLWLENITNKSKNDYSSHIYSESDESALLVKPVLAIYEEDSPYIDGKDIMRACFDAMFTRDPKIFAIGEDVGKIGDVNQAFAGLQEKFGELRITDTGIRECTIIGQGIGAALRGLKPIAEIQYLDYFLYAIQILSDDLACLQYRTKGGQKAPLIIRTRGHRLEGTWHAGSPLGTIIHALRGIYVLVPRNMTQAAGFYNTMLKSDDASLIIECLNGYRLKEKLPSNIGEFCVPIGIPETLREGNDITIVTYGSMCKIALDAANQLHEDAGINCEVIDVQTLLPFDIKHSILESIKRTNRVLFLDEDVPGGATAFMMREVLEIQNAYKYLDSSPKTLTAKEHRPAYASDGDYFSKPNVEEIFDTVYEIMLESNPKQFLKIY